MCLIFLCKNNLLVSDISSINFSQLVKFIQMFPLHICFHMMVVSTVVRLRPSMILACFSHLSDWLQVMWLPSDLLSPNLL